MSPSWLIDCRNAGNPLIDYTARADEEWRHVTNKSDKIDETHLQGGDIFTLDSRQRSDIFFFSKTLLLITFHVGNLERGRHNSSRSNGKFRIFILFIYDVPNVFTLDFFFFMGLRHISRGSEISPMQGPLPDITQHLQQTPIPPAEFEPAVSAIQRPQTHAFDRAVIGTSILGNFCLISWRVVKLVRNFELSIKISWVKHINK
jgi:hypothetical protein